MSKFATTVGQLVFGAIEQIGNRSALHGKQVVRDRHAEPVFKQWHKRRNPGVSKNGIVYAHRPRRGICAAGCLMIGWLPGSEGVLRANFASKTFAVWAGSASIGLCKQRTVFIRRDRESAAWLFLTRISGGQRTWLSVTMERRSSSRLVPH